MKLLLFLGLFVIIGCQTTQSQYRAVPTFYKVTLRKGDTLSLLAQKFDTTWQDIAATNKIDDPTKLKVGQEIYIIPGSGGYLAKGVRVQSGQSNRVISASPNAAKSGRVVRSSKAVRKNTRGWQGGVRSGFLYDKTKKHLIWPVVGRISSHYGMRWGRMHHGIDIAANRGTPIKAVAAGKVEYAGWRQGYGRTVIINHGSFKTLYAHCRRIRVRKGQGVWQGQSVATVGATGNATSAHLHFEYRPQNKRSLNPLLVLGRERARRRG